MTADQEPSPARMLAFTGISLALIIVGLALLMSDVATPGWILLAAGFAFLAAAFVVRPTRRR